MTMPQGNEVTSLYVCMTKDIRYGLQLEVPLRDEDVTDAATHKFRRFSPLVTGTTELIRESATDERLVHSIMTAMNQKNLGVDGDVASMLLYDNFHRDRREDRKDISLLFSTRISAYYLGYESRAEIFFDPKLKVSTPEGLVDALRQALPSFTVQPLLKREYIEAVEAAFPLP